MSSTKPGFVPTSFSNLGKNVRDLMKKKFDSEHKVKAIVKNSAGYTLEVGSTVDQAQNVRGYFKETAVQPKFTFEAEVNTDPASETKASIKSNKLVQNLTVEGKVNTKGEDKTMVGPVYSTNAEYGREYFNATAEFRTNRSIHRVKGSAVVGFDGVSLGGQIDADVTNGANISDYNVGLEYAKPTYIASLWTEKRADFANLGYFHRLSADQAVGAVFKLELGNQYTHSLTLGEEFILDKHTAVRAKMEIPSGQVGLALEHRLNNPRLLFNLATSFNAKNLTKGVKCDTFGFGVTFGDS